MYLRIKMLAKRWQICYNIFDALVAQLDSASDSDSEGRGFESRRVRQKSKSLVEINISQGFLLCAKSLRTLRRCLADACLFFF